MNLETLQRHDPATAQAILASASLSLGTEHYRSLGEAGLSRDVNALIEEVRVKLGFAKDDDSAKATAAVSRALSRASLGFALQGRDLSTVVDALGAKGQLPPSAYKVSVHREELANFKEKQNFLTRCIHNPDEVFNLSYGDSDEKADKGLSLFLKKQYSGEKKEHWLLIHCERIGSSLDISATMRIFPQVIDLSAIDSLPGMLEAFVDYYGEPFLLPGITGMGKIVKDVQIPDDYPLLPRVTPDPVFLNTGSFRYVETGVSTFVVNNKTSEETLIGRRIVYGYAINIARYMADKTRFA